MANHVCRSTGFYHVHGLIDHNSDQTIAIHGYNILQTGASEKPG